MLQANPGDAAVRTSTRSTLTYLRLAQGWDAASYVAHLRHYNTSAEGMWRRAAGLPAPGFATGPGGAPMQQ